MLFPVLASNKQYNTVSTLLNTSPPIYNKLYIYAHSSDQQLSRCSKLRFNSESLQLLKSSSRYPLYFCRFLLLVPLPMFHPDTQNAEFSLLSCGFLWFESVGPKDSIQANGFKWQERKFKLNVLKSFLMAKAAH